MNQTKNTNVMNYENEVWKPVPGYEGHYEVSDMGRVRSIKFCKIKIIKSKITYQGYCRIGLRKNGVQKLFSVHRLVYEAFEKPISKGLQIDHINAVRNDNRLTNLRPATCHQNIIYGAEMRNSAGKTSSKYIGVCKYIVNDIPYFTIQYMHTWIATFRCEAIAGFVAQMVYDGKIQAEPLKVKRMNISKKSKPACQSLT